MIAPQVIVSQSGARHYLNPKPHFTPGNRVFSQRHQTFCELHLKGDALEHEEATCECCRAMLDAFPLIKQAVDECGRGASVGLVHDRARALGLSELVNDHTFVMTIMDNQGLFTPPPEPEKVEKTDGRKGKR